MLRNLEVIKDLNMYQKKFTDPHMTKGIREKLIVDYMIEMNLLSVVEKLEHFLETENKESYHQCLADLRKRISSLEDLMRVHYGL
jgi:hypothetical protein